MLSEIGPLGGSNDFLGIAYLTVGAATLVATAMLTVADVVVAARRDERPAVATPPPTRRRSGESEVDADVPSDGA